MTRAGLETTGIAVAALLAWLVLLPLAFVAIEAVSGPDGTTFEAVSRFMASPVEWRVLANSMGLAVASVIGSALVGVPLAVLVTRVAFPGRRLVGTLLS
ncbi:MAG: hypothetical protein ACYC2K_18485, partial [Gemmatimonadales bacterium]